MKVGAIYALAVLVVAALAFGTGTALLNTQFFLHDFWFVVDVMWRADQGHTPHIDVQTPVGQAYFWPYALSTALQGPGVPAILFGSTIVGLAAAALSWVLLRGTMRTEVWIFVGLFAVVCAVNPRVFGIWWPNEFNHLASYNRWGWALLAPLAMFAFAPPADGPDRQPQLGRAAIFGLVAGYLMLMKITFGIVAVGYLLVSVVMLRRTLFETGIALVTGGLAVMAVGLLEQNLIFYVSDLKAAFLSSSQDLLSKVRARKVIAMAGAAAGLAALLILLVGAMEPNRTRGLLSRLIMILRPLVFCAAIVVSGFLLAVQNYPRYETPFFLIAVLLAYAWARCWWPQKGPASALVRTVSYGLVAIALVLSLGRGILGIALHRNAINSDDAVQVSAFAGTALENLYLSRELVEAGLTPPPQDNAACRRRYGWSESQLRRAVDTLHLLDRLDLKAPVVLPLDGFNPYPALLNAASPVGPLLWADPGRTISKEQHPAAVRMFGSVDVVVRPTECHHGVSEYLWDIYGAYISAEYELAIDSELTELWVRRR